MLFKICHSHDFAVKFNKQFEVKMKVIVIQNCETENIGFYEEYLIEHKIPYDIFPAYLKQKLPPHTMYDFFIIGGTPISAYEISQHLFLCQEREYLEEVVRSNKFCLGICFGAQLLANIFGAEVKKNRVKEIGIYEVELTPEGKKDPCLAGFPHKFSVFHWHGDTFELPPGAELLATGRDCLHQAFRLKNVLGLQFHLEIGSEEAGIWADRYYRELSLEKKEKEQIVNECRKKEKEMKKLAFRLMDNLFSVCGRE